MKKLLISFVCSLLVTRALLPVSLAQNASPDQPRQDQPKKEVLTNASVIELTNLGLADATIIAKIRQSDGQFDTSLEGLKQLKAAHVSDAVIQEMINPKRGDNPAAASATANGARSDPADPLSPHDPGIYAQEKAAGPLIEIPPTVFTATKAGFLGTALTYGIVKTKMRASVRGATANKSVSEARPVFYFYFPSSASSQAMSAFPIFGASSPGEFVLVKMNQKDKTREVVLMEYNAFTMSSGTQDKAIREFTFEKLKSGIFKVAPKTNLGPGEYCFYYGGSPAGLGFSGGKLFDFRVAATP